MADNYDDIFGISSEQENTASGEFDDIFGITKSNVNPDTPDFKQGIQRGLQNLQASAYGATALAGEGLKNLGAESVGESVKDFGLEGYKRNIEEVKQYPAKYSFKDVYTGDAGVGGTIDYVQGTLGELVPSMVEAGVGALVGSAVAPGPGTVAGGVAGKTILKKGIEKATEQALKRSVGELAEDQIKKQVTSQALKKLGAKAGIGAAVMPVESGGMYGELLAEKGIDAPGTAMLFGSLATALEFAGGNSKLVDTLVDAISKGATGTIKKSAKELLTNIPQEALQEGSQEALNILNTVVNTDEKLLTAQNIERIVESMAAGAVGGGAGAGVNAVFSGQAKDAKLKTDQEIELDRRAANILNLEKDQLNDSVQKLSVDLKLNQEILNDVDKLEAKARELNIEPAELLSKTVYENKNNQVLLDKINAGIKAKEELVKKEYEKLSPEEKAIKDIENKFTAQREENRQKVIDEAQKINTDLDAINKRESIAVDQYAKETDPEKKKLIADRVFNLRKEKNTLTDKQKDIVENKSFAPYTTREERQKILNDLFGTVNVGDKVGIEKDAIDSAKVFQEELSSKNIADYVNHINNVKAEDRKQYLDQLMTKVNVEPNAEKIAEYTDYIKNNLSDIVKQEEAAKAQEAGEKFYTQLFAEEKRPFNVDAYNEVTTKSAEQSAYAFEKAGMGKGQTSSFTDERQVPLTDQQQILVDKNNFEIAKLTEQLNKTIDRTERINFLNQIDTLEKDNALIRTSVEQFDTFEELGNDPANAWYSALENVVKGFQQKQATPDQWKGMIKNYPGIKQEELDWIGLNEWLDKQEGKVSKDALMNFIQENNVQLEEVTIRETNTQYSDAKLPGGKNYKELLITIPEIQNTANEEYKNFYQKMVEKYNEGNYFKLEEKLTKEETDKLDELDKKAIKLSNSNYTSAHFDAPNILAHIRFDERTDSEGNKVLFINEVQSDWHQAGRKSGYQTKNQITTTSELNRIEQKYPNTDFQAYLMGYPDALPLVEQGVSKEDAELYELIATDQSNLPDGRSDIPDAPFKKTWPLLAMKRMVRYAAENGFDKISWPSTLQQIEQIESWPEIEARESDLGQGTSYFVGDYRNVSSIVNRYLVDLPRMLNSEFNRGKWGNAKVEKIEIPQGELNTLTNKYYQDGYEANTLNVFSLPITERMKAKALNEGMPMFELSNGQAYNPSASIKQETNLGNILSAVKSAEGLTGQLANFIADFIPESKLDIKVIIDPSVRSANYVAGKVNTITLRDPSQLTSSIHEITHAVTAREMIANPAIRDQVKLLMDRVKLKAIKEAIITPAQMSLIETEKSSLGYKENLKGNFKYDSVAYGLLNEFEFLAQAMGNEQFQTLLKATTIADKGVLRNAWDAFVEVVMKALGIQGTNKNVFGETLSIIAKLASQENINQSNQTINESYESLEIEQRLPQSDYDAVYAEKNNLLKNIVQQAGIKYHEVKLLADKALGSISTRLKKVDPELSEHLRWLDFKTSQKIIDVLKTAKPLLDATKDMSPVDKSEWNWARLNSDTGKIERIESKYGLTDQVKLLRSKLDQIRADAIEVGYDVGFVEDYWPRVIKDTEGFLQATQGISQRAEFTEAIRSEAKKLGITQTQFEREFPEVKADIISNMILGRHYGIGGPGNIKARVFETIPKVCKILHGC